MANYPDMVDKKLLGVFLDEIKNQFPTSVNNIKSDSKGNITLPNFKGSTSSNNGSNGLVPAPKAGEENLPLLASAKFGILPISGGGTGANSAAAARTNLGIDTLTGFNPVGSIIAFAGNTLPKGYLLCDGSNISRTTYKNLFDVIGTTYGTGDGSTTFTLPNLIDRFIEGSSVAGTYREAGVPNITASVCDIYGNADIGINPKGAFIGFRSGKRESININSSIRTWYEDNYDGFMLNASVSSNIYGKSSTVQPNSINCQYLIRY